MEERRKIRFIREEPIIAMTLRQYYFGVLPKDLHDWFWDWVQDVGAAMRSREYMVGMVASVAYYVLFILAIKLLKIEEVGGIFKYVLEGLGLKLK